MQAQANRIRVCVVLLFLASSLACASIPPLLSQATTATPAIPTLAPYGSTRLPASTSPAQTRVVVPSTPTAAPQPQAAWQQTQTAAQQTTVAMQQTLLAQQAELAALQTQVARQSGTSASGAAPTFLAVTFYSNRDGNWHRYRINADGSGLTQLTRGSTEEQVPTWPAQTSPDGQSVLDQVSAANNQRFISLRNLSTGATQQLTDSGYASWSPTWSEDGNRIAFVSTKDGDSRIYVMNRDGSNINPITQPVSQAPSWSTNGQWIAFVHKDNSFWNLYRIRPDGTGQQLIASNVYSEGWAAWSLDSSVLAFVGMADDNTRHIFLVNSDGTGARQLTLDSGEQLAPTWELVSQDTGLPPATPPAPATAPTPAPAPTMVPMPGVYVTNVTWDPATPTATDQVRFTVTFVNTTGADHFYTWFVSVYVDTQTNRIGQTARQVYTFPPGTSVLTTVNTWRMGVGRPCARAWVGVNWVGDLNTEPDFNNPSQQPYTSPSFRLCGP